jgi:hypothetical protein
VGKAIRFVLLIAGALAAWGLWFAELVWIKGWPGLAWLSGFNWSAVPICALFAFLATIVVSAKRETSTRLAFFTIAAAISLASFALERQIAFHLFAGSFPGRSSFGFGILAILVGLVSSLALTYAANRWLAPMHFWAGILVIFALLAVLPLSFATIRVFPALNGSVDQIHSIKMGYPVFWTSLLVPLALYSGAKKQEKH